MGTTEGTDTNDLSGAMTRLAAVTVAPNVRADIDMLLRWARQAQAFLAATSATARALHDGALVADLAAD